MTPKKLRGVRDRQIARAMRDDQWRFMERIAEHGTLWFCNWNKRRLEEQQDELRTSFVGGRNIGAWLTTHADWFVVGEWNNGRYAMPVQLTDAGRSALANRAPYDMEPIEGGMVEPGWVAIPTARGRIVRSRRPIEIP